MCCIRTAFKVPLGNDLIKASKEHVAIQANHCDSKTMNTLSEYILAGFCTLLFGGMPANSVTVNHTLAESLKAVQKRSFIDSVSFDLNNIAQDTEKAMQALKDEREKS